MERGFPKAGKNSPLTSKPEEEIPSSPGDGGGSGSEGDGGTEAGDGDTEEGDVPGDEDELPPPPENPEMFYIIFDPNVGSGERIYEERAKNTNYFSAYTSFFKTGYAFLGWTKKRILMKFFLGMEV